ncbi:CYR1 [Scenedesmus sp. PABB004]|nr:CYR1 [Scenedesmus sp. PABB004]
MAAAGRRRGPRSPARACLLVLGWMLACGAARAGAQGQRGGGSGALGADGAPALTADARAALLSPWPAAARRRELVLAAVIPGVAPWALVGLALCVRRSGAWRRLLGRARGRRRTARDAGAAGAAAGELSLAAKRSRFPGTPSIALARGRSVVTASDAMVTWVVTDVEGSTLLWEWDAGVMGAAVEAHNAVLRGLLGAHGGHEVRTDGDSFTLAFHDALDAVAYCIQAQEQLLEVPWPPRLLEHPLAAPARLGAACAASIAGGGAGAGLREQGPLVMAGLRVRMGINTGVPDDVFVHDLHDLVEYRGEAREYALADDLAGIAAGGQILLGPKTFQRWNRVFCSQGPMPAGGAGGAQRSEGLAADLTASGGGPGEAPWSPLAANVGGSFARRSVEAVAGMLGGLWHHEQQLAPLQLRSDSRGAPPRLAGSGGSGGSGGSAIVSHLLPRSTGVGGISFAIGTGGAAHPASLAALAAQRASLTRQHAAAQAGAAGRRGASEAEGAGSPGSDRGWPGALGSPVSGGGGSGGGSPTCVQQPQPARGGPLSEAAERSLSAHSATSLGRQGSSAWSSASARGAPAGRRRSVSRMLNYIGRLASSGGRVMQRGGDQVQASGASRAWDDGGRPSSAWGTRRHSSAVWGDDAGSGDGGDGGGRSAVLLDLGFYQWRPDAAPEHAATGAGDAAAVAAAAAAAAGGGLLHLVQVQSERLAPRMLLFDWPLAACTGEDALLQQLLPGFLDAPGAASLLFPAMRSLLGAAGLPPPPRPSVALAFVAPAGLKQVAEALGPEAARACRALFTGVVRECLLAADGYESKEVDGQVMAAFHTPRAAVEWALALQAALLHAPWPAELDALPATAAVPAPPAAPGAAGTSGVFYAPGHVFRGLRARVGIWDGPMDRVLPHGTSGRADFLGPPANRAARLMGAAQGGQVLVEHGIMQSVLAEWRELEAAKAATVAAAAATGGAGGKAPPPPAASGGAALASPRPGARDGLLASLPRGGGRSTRRGTAELADGCAGPGSLLATPRWGLASARPRDRAAHPWEELAPPSPGRRAGQPCGAHAAAAGSELEAALQVVITPVAWPGAASDSGGAGAHLAHLLPRPAFALQAATAAVLPPLAHSSGGAESPASQLPCCPAPSSDAAGCPFLLSAGLSGDLTLAEALAARASAGADAASPAPLPAPGASSGEPPPAAAQPGAPGPRGAALAAGPSRLRLRPALSVIVDEPAHERPGRRGWAPHAAALRLGASRSGGGGTTEGVSLAGGQATLESLARVRASRQSRRGDASLSGSGGGGGGGAAWPQHFGAGSHSGAERARPPAGPASATRPADGGAWDAFTSSLRGSLSGAPSAARLAAPQLQHAGSPASEPAAGPAPPGVMAECFRIAPVGAAPGGCGGADGGKGQQAASVTLIKYRAVRQQAAQQAAALDEAVPLGPRLAAAAAAATAGGSGPASSAGGASVASAGLAAGGQLGRVAVAVAVHRVGSFRLKGVDANVEVVSVLPAAWAARLDHTPAAPPAARGAKSQCVAPASGLVGCATAQLPDLALLMAQQRRAWEEQQAVAAESHGAAPPAGGDEARDAAAGGGTQF